MPRRSSLLLLLCLALASAGAGSARGASTTKVVAIGDRAPGGGVFAGPSFTTWPAAGGEGWIAVRSRVEGGQTSEALILARMKSPTTRVEVARIGGRTPDGGTFRQFLGRPAVNANGDVAFLALVTSPGGQETASDQPAPAGVFLFHQTVAPGERQVAVVASSGDTTGFGTLDLAASPDPLDDRGGTDVLQRGPALNDRGDVAFLSAIHNATTAGGVLFVRRAGAVLAPLLAPGTHTANGTFFRIGPPAMNNAGAIAFHGTLIEGGGTEAVFRIGGGAPLSLLVQSGVEVQEEDPAPNRQAVTDFGDLLDIDEAGNVAFTGGPLLDKNRTDGRGRPGALLYEAASGSVRLIAYPGQEIEPHGTRIRSIELGPAGRYATVPPVIAPDGSLVLAVSLNGGSSEALMRVDGPNLQRFTRLVTTAGVDAEASPAAGILGGLEGGPTIDGVGGVGFLAHVAGGLTPEAVVYYGPTGEHTAVTVGEGSPTQGYLAGNPFSAPRMNDAGDIVFRGFIARGQSSTAIVRARPGHADILTAAGQPSPPGSDYPFVDFPGVPSINTAGTVVFTAQVLDRGRGIYVVDGGDLRAVVEAGDPVPGVSDATFRTVGANPAIDDTGRIAFRATYRVHDPDGGQDVSYEGLFLVDGGYVGLLARSGDPSPASGQPFVELRDPVLAGPRRLVFPAVVGSATSTLDGIFAAGEAGVSTLALAQQDLGSGLRLTGFSGSPVVDGAGNAIFLAKRTSDTRDVGPALLRRSDARLELLAARGTSGPVGGKLRSFGQPAVNTAGDVTFLASFLPDSGGTRGFLLRSTDGTMRPIVSIGDTSPLGGTFTAFGARAALGTNGTLAFTADVSGAAAPLGLFLASPTTLRVPELTLRLSGGRRRDRLRLRLALEPGVSSDGVDAGREAIVVTLADATGALWEQRIPGDALRARNQAFVLPRRKGLRHVKAVRLVTGLQGTIGLEVQTRNLDLTQFGFRPIVPPFHVGLAIGDDSGDARVSCELGPRGGTCSAP
ncbi:MAG: choice-of-anchor tandem repeat NxxGxxAF-containing protein [Candidatus Binatia bacterium]